MCYIIFCLVVTVQDLREAKLHVFTDLDCQHNTVPLEQEVDTNITYCAGYKFGFISGCQVMDRNMLYFAGYQVCNIVTAGYNQVV